MMGYLSLAVLTPEGALVYETDFGMRELIPLVRQIARHAEGREDRPPETAGYRAIVTPGYDWRGCAETAPVIEEGRSVTLADEIQAYFSPGCDPLCSRCPEQHRCPGSGRPLSVDPDSWIVLDPEAPRTGEPIRYLTVRLVAPDGRIWHTEEAGLEALEPFVMVVSALLRRAGRLPWSTRTRYPARIHARHEGRPTIDPMLNADGRARLVVRFLNLDTAAVPNSPPDTLVDWDSLERDDDLEINLLETNSPELPRRPPPEGPQVEIHGVPEQGAVQIFIQRSVLGQLRAASCEATRKIEGLLVGEAYLTPADGRPWIGIAGLLPSAAPQSAEGARLAIPEGEAQPENGRTLGWYSSRRLPDLHLTAGSERSLVFHRAPERLEPTSEERFFHSHFFSEPWHVGLIVDGVGDRLSFFRQRGDGLVSCPGFAVLD